MKSFSAIIKENKIASALILITFAGMLIWENCVPFCADDFFYRTVSYSSNPAVVMESPDIETFADAVDAIDYHIRTLNGRLANFAFIVLQLAPRPVSGLLLAMTAAGLVLLITAITSRKGASTAVAAMTATLLIWTALPWYDNMFSYAFQMNYTASSLLLLWTIYLYDPYRSGRSSLALPFLCFLCGWWHEGFGCPLIAWLSAAWLTDRRRRTFIPVIAAAAGVAINILGGTMLRLQHYSVTARLSEALPGLMSHLLLQPWVLYLCFAAAIAWLFRGNKRAKMRYLLPYAVGALTSWAIAAVTLTNGRGMWAAEILAIVPLTHMAALTARRIQPRIITIAAIAFCPLYSIWLADMCRWSFKIKEENAAFEASVAPRRNRPVNVFFTDLTPTDDVPIHLKNVVFQPLHHFFDATAAFSYYNLQRSPAAILPDSLRHTDYNSWPVIDGTAGLRGVWPMVFSEPPARDITLVFGQPTENMPVSDRILSIKNHADSAGLYPARPPFRDIKVVTEQGTELVWYTWLEFPRTYKNRPLIRIDLHQQ